MKKNLFIICLMAVVSLANAQDVKKETYINPAQVDAVCNLGEMAAVLVKEGFRPTDNAELYTLHYLDESVATQEVNLPRGYRLHDVKSWGDEGAMIFNGSNDAIVVLVKPDTDPAYVTITTAKDYKFKPINYADVSGEGNMVLGRTYAKMGLNDKGKEAVVETGLEYINLDSDGNVINVRREVYDEEKPYQLADSFSTPEGMIYHLEHVGSRKKDYDSKLIICDNSGNVTGEYSLTGIEQSFFPSDIINDNGSLVMAGFYMNGNVFTAKRTEGMFMAIIDESGSEKSKTTYDWDNLKSQLKETQRGEFNFNGKMNVMIEKIENNGSGYTILGESYGTSSGVTAAESLIGGNDRSELVVTVLDFVLFDTDYNGNLTSVKILEKEECNIMMEGFTKGIRAVRLARILDNYNVFPYKSFENGTISFINYKAKEGAFAQMNSSTGEITMGTPIDIEIVREEVVDVDAEEAVSNSKFLTKLDNLDKKLDKFEDKLDKVGGKLAYEIEKIDQVFNRRGFSNKGLFFLSNGKVISYEMDQESYAVYYSYLN